MHNISEIEVENKEIIKESSYERIYYMDILRIMAITAVILVHIASNPTDQLQFIGTTHWWIADIINGSLRWTIPIFFMLSGALLLDSKKEEDIVHFYKRSFKRLGIPFIVWSVIYFLLKYYCFKYNEPVEGIAMVGIFFKEFLVDDIYSHLWFMYSIIGMYFISPFLKKMVRSLSKKELLIILWAWVVVSFIYPQICRIYNMITNSEIQIRIFELPFLMGYAGYFILGYYLKKYDVKKKTKFIIYILGFISSVIVAPLTYLVSINKTSLDEQFFEHFVVISLFMAMAVFILIKDINWKEILNDNMKKIIVSLSSSTFGIYFVHLVVEVLILSPLTSKLYKDSLLIIPLYIVCAIGNVFISYIFTKIVSLNSKLKILLVG